MWRIVILNNMRHIFFTAKTRCQNGKAIGSDINVMNGPTPQLIEPLIHFTRSMPQPFLAHAAKNRSDAQRVLGFRTWPLLVLMFWGIRCRPALPRLPVPASP